MRMKVLEIRVLFVLVVIVWSSVTLSQVKPKEQAKAVLARQNNPGRLANNFSYFTVDGSKKQLYGLQAKYTLLFFYNPECDACKVYKDLLRKSALINDRIKKGLLKVLAVYIDQDVSVWKKHLPEMPRAWIHGRDENEYLYKNAVYDLHAIPTIYLLDRNKKVILKDVLDVSVIEAKLIN